MNNRNNLSQTKGSQFVYLNRKCCYKMFQLYSIYTIFDESMIKYASFGLLTDRESLRNDSNLDNHS